MKVFTKDQELIANYYNRTDKREETLMSATMNMIAYFMGTGDSQVNAETKVSQLSTEVAPLLYVFTLGNVQPLKDAINASTLPFMNQAAKDYIIAQLSV
jgi:hypothetical protein